MTTTPMVVAIKVSVSSFSLALRNTLRYEPCMVYNASQPAGTSMRPAQKLLSERMCPSISLHGVPSSAALRNTNRAPHASMADKVSQSIYLIVCLFFTILRWLL